MYQEIDAIDRQQNIEVLEESWNLMNRTLNEPKDSFAVALAMSFFISIFLIYHSKGIDALS